MAQLVRWLDFWSEIKYVCDDAAARGFHSFFSPDPATAHG